MAHASTVDAGLALVGDIGGTNARFGLTRLDAPRPEVAQARAYVGRDYATALDALEAYLAEVGGPRPAAVALAVAGPVRGGEIRFTNTDWRLSEQGLREVGFQTARLVNDYAALALAAPLLEGDDLHRLGGGGPACRPGTVAVAGPGTGFGASALVRADGVTLPLAGEAGHVSFAPTDELEIQVLRVLQKRFGRVSVERILSGAGLADLHGALAEIEGRTVEEHGPAAITNAAMAGAPAALATVRRFCAILGAVVGDFALSVGADGGVFLGGGIAPRILPILDQGEFRSRFEHKGRFEAYMRAIPTSVIVRPHAALLGAAQALRDQIGDAHAVTETEENFSRTGADRGNAGVGLS